MNFLIPKRERTREGTLRRAGFEIECTGLDLGIAAELVQQLYGGELVRHGRFSRRVTGTPWGEFRIELDARLLQEERYWKWLGNLGISREDRDVRETVEEWVDWFAAPLVPLEITTPPLPLADLPELERLRNALQTHQAEGTEASLFYAFGLHINVEAPELSYAVVLAFLQAYLLLEEWIQEKAGTDLARRISPYIDPFPKSFVRAVLRPGYARSPERLAGDYLRANPTRNRGLDLLPLLATLAPDQVKALLDPEEKVSARPAFHFRLPNCKVDSPTWTLASEWNHWVAVDNLASEPDRIALLARAWEQWQDGLPPRFTEDWIQTVDRFLA